MGREINPLVAKEIERLNFKLAEVEFQRDNLQSEINRLKEEQYSNMQQYMERCKYLGYITPQDFLSQNKQQ